MPNFSDFGLAAPLLESLGRLGFTEPTPIQAQSIPLALQGHDVIGRAATGSGKTAAFLLPMLHKIQPGDGQMALILVPTRELAVQAATVFRSIAADTRGAECAVVIGGAPMGPQIRALKHRPLVIIATPGRLNDHLDQRTVTLERVGFLVLDEADRMLDMGFAPQLDRILRHLPVKRQTMLFSATLPEDIQKMARKYLKDPKSVYIGPAHAPMPKITQKIIHIGAADKAARLITELHERQGSVVVFARTQHRADRLGRTLHKEGFAVSILHGGMPQGKRKRNLDDFRDGTTRVLVATDIAARGLDVPHVAHVVNFDLPMQAEDYVHRIGRTARAGAEGEALCFVSPEETPLLKAILRHTGSATVEGTAPLHVPAKAKPATGRGGANRNYGPRPGGNSRFGGKSGGAGRGSFRGGASDEGAPRGGSSEGGSRYTRSTPTGGGARSGGQRSSSGGGYGNARPSNSGGARPSGGSNSSARPANSGAARPASSAPRSGEATSAPRPQGLRARFGFGRGKK